MDYLETAKQLNIGNTTLLKLDTDFFGVDGNIYLKCEYENASGSVKDRPALSMIIETVNRNLLQAGGTIVEATSGNTGIALAYIGKKLGYKVVLTMPDSMSVERRQILQNLGAELVLTDGSLAMAGAVEKAKELAKTLQNAVEVKQFENLANPLAHKISTAPEIIVELEKLKITPDIFVAGVGTGGTISGVSEVLKNHYKNLQTVAVEPAESAVLSGCAKGSHLIQGIGAGFVPQTLNLDVVDQIETVAGDDAVAMAETLNFKLGLPVGISSGANVFMALKLLKSSPKGTTIITVLPDKNDRYKIIDN